MSKRKAPEADTATLPSLDITNDLLRNRLRRGLGMKGGTRGSLTRLAGFVHKKTENQLLLLINEAKLVQLEMTQWILTTQRNLQECDALQKKNTPQQSDELKVSVQSKRVELQQQLEVTSCEREYDALAKIATKRHPVSRRVLQEQLSECEEKIRTAKEQLALGRAQMNVRLGQFQLLMQSILDLKQSLKEPLDDVVPEKEEGEEDDGEIEEDPMDLDKQDEDAKAGNDDDDELYDDL